MKKTALIQFWNASPHFETSLEIAIKASASSVESLTYCFWGKHIKFNECYTAHANNLLAKEDKARQLTDSLFDWNFDLPLGVLEKEVEEFNLLSIAHLRRLQYDSQPLGVYLASALIDRFKSIPDPQEHESFINSMYSTFVTVYLNTLKFIDDNDIATLILFNGRHVPYAAASCAAKRRGIDVKYHERGGNNARYVLMDDKVHSVLHYQKLLKDTWDLKSCSNEDAFSIAKSILEGTLKKQSPEAAQHRRFQKENCLPSIDSSNLNIAYFASSMDEIRYISDQSLWPIGAWDEQCAAVLDLIGCAMKVSLDLKVHVRLHPSIAAKKNELDFWKFLYDIYPENLIVIGPEEPVDSYELSQRMDLNFAFHSSIGGEIMSLGQPIYTFNTALYDYLYGCTLIKNSSHLLQVIRDRCNGLDAFDSSQVSLSGLRHLYSKRNFGIPYVYYEPLSAHHGRFLGIQL